MIFLYCKIQLPLVCLNSLCLCLLLRIQFHIFGSMEFAVYVLNSHLADKLAVELRRRFQIEPERVVHRHAAVDIALVLPFGVGLHLPVLIPERRERIPADVKDRPVARDVNGALSTEPDASSGGSDIKDRGIRASFSVADRDRDLFLPRHIIQRDLMSRRQDGFHCFVHALAALVRHLCKRPGFRGILQIRSCCHKKRILRDMQSIVFIRADPHIAGGGLITAIAVSEQDRIEDLRGVVRLLRRELKSKLSILFLKGGQLPVQCALFEPISGIRINKIFIGL